MEKTFTAGDGARLTFDDRGAGFPVLLLHGFIASAQANFIAPGIAAAVTGAGFRAILPDHRGHGRSAAPEDPALYPPNVLVADALALVDHLALSDYALVGYSLGARVAIQMLAAGVRPRCAVLGGMGESAVDGGARRAFFAAALNGEAVPGAERVRAFVTAMGMSLNAARHVQASIRDTPAAALAEIPTPILCLNGAEDFDNGDGAKLAALFPAARVQRTGGNHMTAISDPTYAQAIVAFLKEHCP
jgi:pimeloyl-ACP methyl ester carboxylesterase